jgi:hypothetical protein
MRTLLLKLTPLFLCLILLTGCGKIKIDWVDDGADNSPAYVSAIEQSLGDRTKDECLYLYKFYAGGAQYVHNAYEKVGTTDKWESLVQEVHKDYKWELQKDADFTEALRKELETRGFADPKSLSDVATRTALEKVLNETAEGALRAADKK